MHLQPNIRTNQSEHMKYDIHFKCIEFLGNFQRDVFVGQLWSHSLDERQKRNVLIICISLNKVTPTPWRLVQSSSIKTLRTNGWLVRRAPTLLLHKTTSDWYFTPSWHPTSSNTPLPSPLPPVYGPALTPLCPSTQRLLCPPFQSSSYHP